MIPNHVRQMQEAIETTEYLHLALTRAAAAARAQTTDAESIDALLLERADRDIRRAGEILRQCPLIAADMPSDRTLRIQRHEHLLGIANAAECLLTVAHSTARRRQAMLELALALGRMEIFATRYADRLHPSCDAAYEAQLHRTSERHAAFRRAEQELLAGIMTAAVRYVQNNWHGDLETLRQRVQARHLGAEMYRDVAGLDYNGHVF